MEILREQINTIHQLYIYTILQFYTAVREGFIIFYRIKSPPLEVKKNPEKPYKHKKTPKKAPKRVSLQVQTFSDKNMMNPSLTELQSYTVESV